jgi:hypothetical protein
MKDGERGEGPVVNTDREIWRETPDDFYAPSIHVTQGGGIGINVGGMVNVKPVREWHALASSQATIRELVEALKGARRILSIYVTDDSPQEDIVDANMIDEVLAKANEGRG